MKIILLNGPPSSGKDTAAKAYYGSKNNVVFERFSAPLKTSFAAIAGRSYNQFYEVDYYEAHKEEPIPWLNNVSFRQYQINLSELHFKPLYGQEVFGNLFTARLQNYAPDSIVVVPDSGFKTEIDVLEKSVNHRDVLLIRTHREGYDFSKDSRGYVYSDKFMSVDLYNNGSQVAFENTACTIVENFRYNKKKEEGVNI